MNDRQRARILEDHPELREAWLESGMIKRWWIATHRAEIDAAPPRQKIVALKGSKTTSMRHGDFSITVKRTGDDFSWDTPDRIDPSLILGALEWCKHKIIREFFSPKEDK